mmetsp:Transcript_26438/g.76307  ORF Transcript_26438/g.76307 Transcript_26438/m.76307 type:complete len:592 (+) Transcript_26438:308-2083(+)
MTAKEVSNGSSGGSETAASAADAPPQAQAASTTTSAEAASAAGSGSEQYGQAAPSADAAASNRRYQRKLSISEEATLASSKRFAPPHFLKVLFETPFRTKNPNHGGHLEEATGWGMDAAGRGPLNQAGSYIGVAIIQLATIDAGCGDVGAARCPNRIYGLRPSSMLTMASVITGVTSALLMPFIGAVVDHTRHRKAVGVLTAILVCAITGFQIAISLDTWFACLVAEMFGGFALIMHFMSVMAYLPDLTVVEVELTHYPSRFNIVMYSVQIVYVLFLIGMTYGLGLGSIDTARVAAAGAFAFAVVLFTYAWTFLFRKRPALSKVNPGDNLVNSGFKQIGRTTKKIFTRYHSLRWFMLALLFSPEAGAGVVLSVAVTYLAVTLRMVSIEVGIVNLILLVSTIPGSLFSNWFMQKKNPLITFRYGLMFLAVTIGVTVAALDRPERKKWTYLVSVFWGLAYGWIFPAQRTLQVTLTPRGQEAEIMGMFTFVTQVIGWLPALIFSIMNENGVNMQWSVSVLAWFLLVSILLLYGVGDYDAAVQQVKEVGEQELAEMTAARAEVEDMVAEQGEGVFVDEVVDEGKEDPRFNITDED